MVRLAKHDVEPVLFGPRRCSLFYVLEGGAPIDLGLAGAQKIEVRPVKDIYR
jgi:hypothetical protein